MKKIFCVLTLLLLSAYSLSFAQQSDTLAYDDKTIYLNSSGNSSISSNDDGELSLMFNGRHININSSTADITYSSTTPKKGKRVYPAFIGIGAPRENHFSLLEVGSNFLVQTNYSAYTPEEADALRFTTNKSAFVTINVMTLNAALTRDRSLFFSTALAFQMESYKFANKCTMEYRDGMMRPVALADSYKSSKLNISYVHIPITLDWNISHGIFISAGVNLDILMTSGLVYKKPRTTITGATTLSPVEVGVTARFGWRRFYCAANYSFMDMFKQGTGPEGRRMSIGFGLFL